MILISHLNAFFSAVTLCVFFSLTLLRLSVAKLKISLVKCHIAFENMWVIFKYLLILLSNNSAVIREQTLHSFNTFWPWNFASCFISLGIFQCLLVYGNLNRTCILLLCENCISLNYVELVHSAFQVYYILLLLYIFILLIFEFAIETPTKNLNLST